MEVHRSGGLEIPMQWDDRYDHEFTYVAEAPQSGGNPGWGPAGPGGVSMLLGAGVEVALDQFTGRISSIKVGEHLDERDVGLLRCLLTEAGVREISRQGGHGDRYVEVLPAVERPLVTRAANLEDAATHVQLQPGSVARFLLAVERAGVLTHLHAEAPDWVDDRLASRAQALAERSLEGIGDGELAELLPPRTSIDGVSRACARLMDELPDPLRTGPVGDRLRCWAAAAAPRPPAKGDGGASLGAEVLPRGQEAFDLAAHKEPLLLAGGRTPPRLVARAGELVTHELATVAVSEGLLPFDDDALRSFGLTPGGSLQREGGGWLLVSFPRRRTTRMVDAGTEGHLKGEVPWESGAIPEEPAWITVLDQAGIVIGAGELRYGEQDAAAHIAVDGEPVKVGIGRHPFRRGVGWRSPYDDVAAADRLTKVAHWAAHTERPSLALRCFEEAVVAWLDLGDVFRAAWAWHRADHARLELELDQIDPGLVAALRAVISTGDVPDTDFGSDRIGAWAWAADLDLLRERR